MTNYIPVTDDLYRRYAELLLGHHKLLCEGREAAEEAEAIEEEMTRLWSELDELQKGSLSGLSSDLNWLQRRCQVAPRGRPAEDVVAEDVEKAFQARERGDWHALLHYLRLCSPKLPPFQLACLRATAWQALAFPQISRVFYEQAVELEPRNAGLAVLALHIGVETRMNNRARSVE